MRDATPRPASRRIQASRHLRSALALVLALAVVAALAVTALAVTALAQKPPAGTAAPAKPGPAPAKPAPAPAKPAPAPAQTPRPSAVIVIPGARVLDAASGAYLPPATIVIEDGRIKSMTPEMPANLPASATTLKTDGGIVVPGLIDAHAWAAPTTDLDSDYGYLMGLAHGVTTYRVLNARTSWAVGQRARARSGTILAPRLVTSGRGIQQGATPGRWLFDAPDARTAAAEVQQQVAAGVDWIAAYDNLSPDIIKAMLAAAKDTPVRISAWPGASSLAELADLRVASIESLGFPLKPRAGSSEDVWLAATAKEVTGLRTRLIRSKAVLVPMLAATRMRAYPAEAIDSPALALLPEARRTAITNELKALAPADVAKAKRVWALQAAFVAQFVRAGGRVAAGSGFEWRGYPPPGIGLHLELSALVRAGLSPEDALRTATTNAADLMGSDKEIGLVAPGVEANFIIVQGDPLKRIQDLQKITTVVRGGEVFDAKALLARAQAALAVGPR
jgi:imidazolonepropionase-like amidohydrolase